MIRNDAEIEGRHVVGVEVDFCHGFFRYTLSPTFSSRFGIVTFPSVEAMMIVFPDAEGPNSLLRSTLIVSMVPSTVISTFFTMVSSRDARSQFSNRIADTSPLCGGDEF